MKNLIKKTCGFLIFLSLLLSFSQLVFAEGCDGLSKSAAGDAMMNGKGTSYVLSVLDEPISGFDEVMKDENDVTISQVFMKYKCENENEWKYQAYSSGGTCPAESEYCTYVQLILSQSGTGLLKTYIAILYRWAAGIVGIISVLVIVISGIQISVDQGSGESVGSAKNRIMQSLAGLVILFLSALILYTVNPTFFK